MKVKLVKNSQKDVLKVILSDTCTQSQVKNMIIKPLNRHLNIVTLVIKKLANNRMFIGHVSIVILTYARKYFSYKELVEVIKIMSVHLIIHFNLSQNLLDL